MGVFLVTVGFLSRIDFQKKADCPRGYSDTDTATELEHV